MSRFSLCSGFYTSQSPLASAEMCRNWYPEIIESEGGKTRMALYPTPGLKAFFTGSAEKPVRMLCSFTPPNTSTERFFAVIGPKFYEISSAGAILRTQSVKNDALLCTYACGQTQLLIQSSDAAYVFTFATNTWTVLAGTLDNVAMVEMLRGYFIALIRNSNKYQYSALLDATTWPGANTNAINEFPDNIRSIFVDHEELLIGGSRKSIAHYLSGSQNLFDFIPSSLIEQGIGAALSRVKLDNTVYWIQADERGQAVAVKIDGYRPVRVSTHAIEYIWQGYSTISDAVGFSYQDQGHSFWVIYFPTANATWVYDAATQLWHERTSFVAGKEQAHLGQCHTFAFGKHFVGDRNSGTIYQMAIPKASGTSWTFCDDNGTPIRHTRRSPYIAKEQEWIYFQNLEIELEAGLGPQPPLYDGNGQPRDPQLFLRWSNDGARTWSDEITLNCGKAGEFIKRIRQFRLGRCWGTRGRIFEISCSDPIPWRIIDGHVIASPDFQPTKRLAAAMRESA